MAQVLHPKPRAAKNIHKATTLAEQELKGVFLLDIVGTIAGFVGCVALFSAAQLWMALSVLLLGIAVQVPKALRDSAD